MRCSTGLPNIRKVSEKSLGSDETTVVGRNRKQCICKFLGVKEVYYGICASRELDSKTRDAKFVVEHDIRRIFSHTQHAHIIARSRVVTICTV